MTKITQGHTENNGHTSPRVARRLRPRRSVVASSLALLIGGTILSTTALPALANVSPGTVGLGTGTTIPVSTTAGTVATTPSARIAPMAYAPNALNPRAIALSLRARVTTTSKTSLTSSAQDSTSTTTPAPTPTTTPTPTPTTTPPATTPKASGSGTSTTSTTPTTTPAPPTTSTTLPTTTTTVKPAPAPKAVSISNPSANINPDPDFLVSGQSTFVGGVWTNTNPCVVGSATGIAWPGFIDTPACNNYVLTAIDNARSREGVGPMVLPSNWYTLTTPEQLFVIADLERTARGLPPYLGLNATLTGEAQHAAASNADPGVASGFPIAYDGQGYPEMGGAWSGGFSVLAADYIWMYADGWGGSASQTSNIACTSPSAAGCWAHRDELLGSDPGFNPGVGLTTTTCEMGTGFAMVNGNASYVDLVETPAKGAQPPMTFTWAANVAPFL